MRYEDWIKYEDARRTGFAPLLWPGRRFPLAKKEPHLPDLRIYHNDKLAIIVFSVRDRIQVR